jgi:endo-1,4-beta-xylanase
MEGFNDEVHFTDNIGYKLFGKKYVSVVVKAIHEADPDAEIVINDYGPETNPQGRGKFLLEDIIKPLKEEIGEEVFEDKLKVGVQGHVYEIPRDTIDTRLRDLMGKFGELAVETWVTELDVTGTKGPEVQAKQYADVLRMCLEVLSCEGVSFWGLPDKYGSTVGLENNHLKPGDALPYTADYRQKLAIKAMREVLRS